MRGMDERSGLLFSYVDLEGRVPGSHPRRAIRLIVNEALSILTARFEALYSPFGRPSIPPEQLLRAMLLQAFYSIRSERQLMERLDFDLSFRWFVGLGRHRTQRAAARPSTGARRAIPAMPSASASASGLKSCLAGQRLAGQRKTRFRGLPRVRWAFTFAMAAYNLIRLPKLLGAIVA